MSFAIGLCILSAEAIDGPTAKDVSSQLPALKVEGNHLVALGQTIRLRGIDWGWWHLSGTRYAESDMRHVAEWGANTVRLAFSYGDLESDDHPGLWKEDGFRQLDEVVQWAGRYRIYLILDMHVIPGGQDPAPYCAGGHDRVWTDAVSQERFIALWQEIARRYRDRPEIAAYELMNEPESKQKTPQLLVDLDQRAIAAIRAIDPDRILVVGGDHWSSPSALVDAMKLPDSNILYTFHWYEGTGSSPSSPKLADREAFKRKMEPSLAFAAKFNVPVWVGEFGCESADPGYQTRWVNTSIALFEDAGFEWTYWNDRETSKPGSMALHPEHADGSDYPVNEVLLKALRAGWARNAASR